MCQLSRVQDDETFHFSSLEVFFFQPISWRLKFNYLDHILLFCCEYRYIVVPFELLIDVSLSESYQETTRLRLLVINQIMNGNQSECHCVKVICGVSHCDMVVEGLIPHQHGNRLFAIGLLLGSSHQMLPAKSLDTSSHLMVFLCFHDCLHYRFSTSITTITEQVEL